MERVNPMYFSYDKSPDLEFIEDGAWCCRRMRLPITEVYDRYYEKLTEKTFPMTLLVANADFAKNNKKLIKKIAALYAKSNEWTVKNPKEAGILAEKANLGLKAAVAEKSIPNANFIWQDSLTAKKQIESILSVFLQESPQSIGGKLPDDDFYFSLK